MKKLKKIKLNEKEIITRLSKGEMNSLTGGGSPQQDELLACGGDTWKHSACDRCQA